MTCIQTHFLNPIVLNFLSFQFKIIIHLHHSNDVEIGAAVLQWAMENWSRWVIILSKEPWRVSSRWRHTCIKDTIREKPANLWNNTKKMEPLLQQTEWTGCTHTQMGMMEAVMSLDQLVDESDPDVDFPNSFHAFQTAEGIRQVHPDKGR